MIGQKTVPGSDGGIERVVEELSTRMVEDGHEVTLFNRKRKKTQFVSEYKGVKIKEIFTINRKSFDAIIYSYFATKKAIKEAKKGKYDVIHFHAEGPCNYLYKFGKLNSKKRKKMPKIVVTIHGLDWQRNKWGRIATSVILRGEKQAVKYADEIIVLSKNNHRYFKDKYNRDTTFIPNGVVKATLHEPEIIKERWSLDKNNYILFLARLVPEKGAHYLIEAWKRVKQQIQTDKKLVIAGGVSHSKEYYNQIQEMVKDDDSIIMTDFVSGQTLQELFSNAYLYVLPSDIEGMPMSLLEALSYGNCCLVSDIPENTEVINGDCFVFEQGNVDRLRHQIKKIINLNIQSHENMIQVYTWDDVVNKTLAIYNK